MKLTIWLLLILCFFLAGGLAFVCGKWQREKKWIKRLEEQIDLFLQEGEAMAFSVEDGVEAQLENAIAHLEDAILLERGNQKKMKEEESRLIADISHQFKTPLAGLKLFCEMDNGPHRQKQLALIDRMNGLIYSLLRLEKLRVGAYEMKFAPCALNGLLRGIEEDMRQLYLHIQISQTGNAQMRCDANWMREALSNIIKNACEHAKTSVSIALEQGQGDVSISIEDDGPGVEEEKLPLLFGRFSSLSAKAGGGTGLGLAIAKAIVEKHHGVIMAENAKQGLKVLLTFPKLEGKLSSC